MIHRYRTLKSEDSAKRQKDWQWIKRCFVNVIQFSQLNQILMGHLINNTFNSFSFANFCKLIHHLFFNKGSTLFLLQVATRDFIQNIYDYTFWLEPLYNWSDYRCLVNCRWERDREMYVVLCFSRKRSHYVFVLEIFI